MNQQIENINKQLQIAIGKLIGKDYFKLEDGCKVQLELFSSWTNEGSDTEYSSEPDNFETGILLNGEVLGCKNGNLRYMDLEEKDFKNGVYTYGVDENGGISVEEYEKVEILGQEPTLNDVLLAIPIVVHLSNCIISKDGQIGQIDTGENIIYYDLTKSLFDQSTETKLAIIKLLE